MRTLSVIAVAILLCLASPAALSQRAILDDALSPRQSVAVNLTWQPQDVVAAMNALINDDAEALPPLNGQIPNVEIRLNTRQWIGERVRIYLSLPANIVGDNSAGTLRLSWRSSGAFEAGSVFPGSEALIYEGLIESPVTSGTFDFVLSLESDGIPDSFSFEPIYELEIIL